MALDIYKATQPFEFYMKFIKQNLRPDNRRLSDIRPCKISTDCINTPHGSSLVKLGSTNVVCGINARVCAPRDDQPNKGFIVCNVELPALCSAKNFKTAASHQSSAVSQSSLASTSIEQSQAILTQLLQDIITESKCIREEDLCIKEGKLVWVLYIDLICLNNDGNVQDACCLAMISALKSLKLYEMEFDEENNRPVTKFPLVTKPIKLYSEPVCTTLFSLQDNIILADPNKQEEEFLQSYLVICTLSEKKLCLIRKFGGACLSFEQINSCIDRAIENGDFMRKNFYNISNTTNGSS